MRIQILALSLFFANAIHAEEAANISVPEITVFGAAAKSSSLDFVPAVSELSGTRLQRKKQSTVGETLGNEVGVTSSQFGPNASRPIIRGLEGDRVRILQNGTGVLDASSASPDHAVAIDPGVVERMETVRGPAALLYGSSAIGGVVNLVTTRIPEKVPDKFSAKAETRFSSTDLGRSMGVTADSGLGQKWAAHAEASARGADDYHVPVGDDRVHNSFNRTSSEAFGSSYVFDRGFVGASVSNYNSDYGTVAEPDVKIRMLQQRADIATGVRNLGFIKSLRARNTFSHYKHDELEGGEVGTAFRNDGDEARVDMVHRPLGGMTGVFGVQANVFRFSADGDESFLPETDNQAFSAFIFEERESGTLRPSLGARLDSSRVESSNSDRFGLGETKSFTGGSLSLGFLLELSRSNALVLNSAYTERAPNYQELFASGRHVATAQDIHGNRDLGKERGQALELSWRHKGASSSANVGVFLQDFKDFIALIPTGGDDGDADKPFDTYNYTAVDARLYGAEAEYRHKLPWTVWSGAFDVELKLDAVRGVNRSTGDNLPRMTPMRETLAVIYRSEKWQSDVEVQKVEKQTKLAPNESSTAGYTLVNIGAEKPLHLEALAMSLFARVNNVFDQKARNHVSFLKEIAPLPGRNFILGMQAEF
jgi:iron complex outermembrane receptor protein